MYMITDWNQVKYSNAAKFFMNFRSERCMVIDLTRMVNKCERLFSETNAFRIQLKGNRFYDNIALLISDKNSVKKYFIDC